jgi:divalent metal cation (Fe/Co/Zn/Cd) transporter
MILVIHRAKTSLDVCVVIALAVVAVAPGHPAAPYVDILGSIIVAAYLLWSGLRTATPHLAGMRGLIHGLRKPGS